MDILHIAVTSLVSLAVLFLLTKLIGNRQMSQMSMFDYINGITIGSIAAEFATSLEDDYRKPLTAMLVYGLVVAGVAVLTCKSISLRRFVNGKPLILYESGTLYEKNLMRARLDINEFLTQCRVGGYFDLRDLQSAILETNGQISFLPTAKKRPVTPDDLQLTPSPAAPAIALILDGKLLEANLKHSGNNDIWLKNELAAQHIHGLDEVFLAMCDAENTLTVYKKTGKKMKRDVFE
ncbi:MAG: DUF421 domain-containing protein [Ruthenibacterium sp.]